MKVMSSFFWWCQNGIAWKRFWNISFREKADDAFNLLANWIRTCKGHLCWQILKAGTFLRICGTCGGACPIMGKDLAPLKSCKKLLWSVHSKAAPIWSPAHLSHIPFVVSTVNKCNLFQRWHLVLSEHVTCAALYCELNIQIGFIGYDCPYLQSSHLNLWVAY